MKRRPESKTKPKKKLGRKILKFIFVALIAFSIWYIWDYTKPSNFPIKQAKIFADYKHIEQKDLQAVISPYLKNGFFYLNVFGLKRHLLELPWVYRVSLERKWPDILIVNVIEQGPFLQWGGRALINSSGDVFTPAPSSFPKGLPVVHGPKDKEKEIYSLYKSVAALFEPMDLKIKQMILSSYHYWELTLSNNTVVYLKEENPLSQIEMLANLYRRITADHKKDPKIIDMRYKSGLAVKWS